MADTLKKYIIKFLNQNEFKFQEDTDGVVIGFEIIDNVKIETKIRIYDDSFIFSVTDIPCKVLATRKDAITELVLRLNSQIPIGCFDFSYDTLKIRFKHGHSLPKNVKYDPELVGGWALWGIIAAEENFEYFKRVNAGEITPLQAIKEQEKKDKAEQIESKK